MPILFYPEWAAETVNNLGITRSTNIHSHFYGQREREISGFFCCPPAYSFRLYKCEIITYKIAFCPVDSAPTMYYKNHFFFLPKPTGEPYNSSPKYNAVSDLNFCSRNNICLGGLFDRWYPTGIKYNMANWSCSIRNTEVVLCQ